MLLCILREIIYIIDVTDWRIIAKIEFCNHILSFSEEEILYYYIETENKDEDTDQLRKSKKGKKKNKTKA